MDELQATLARTTSTFESTLLLKEESFKKQLAEEKKKSETSLRETLRESNKSVKEALDKLRKVEEERTSEVKMLAYFRKKEQERVEVERVAGQEKEASVALQKVVRGRFARRNVEAIKTRREVCSTVLSRFIRHRVATLKVANLRAEKEENLAAVVLQNRMRCRTASAELGKRQEAHRQEVRILQEAQRQMEEEAAASVQCRVRGWGARRRVEEMKVEKREQEEAAVVLQGKIRGRGAKKKVAKLRKGKAEEERIQEVERRRQEKLQESPANAEPELQGLEGILLDSAGEPKIHSPSTPPKKFFPDALNEFLDDKDTPSERVSLQGLLEKELEDDGVLVEIEDAFEVEERQTRADRELVRKVAEDVAAQKLQGWTRVYFAKKELARRREQHDLEVEVEREQQESLAAELRGAEEEEQRAAVVLQARERGRRDKGVLEEKRKQRERQEEKVQEEQVREADEEKKMESEVADEVPEVAAPVAAPVAASDDEDAYSEHSDEQPTSWIEVVDPDTRLTYYYDQATSESSWDLPPSCVGLALQKWTRNESDGSWSLYDAPPNTPSKMLFPSTPQGKGDFKETPEWKLKRTSSKVVMKENEWVVYHDEGRDLPFYYNIVTGGSTWSKPHGVHVSDPSPAEDEKKQEAAEVEDEDWQLKRENSVRELSKGGWTKYKDPSTNATFYYNDRTSESAWDKPDDWLDDEDIDEYVCERSEHISFTRASKSPYQNTPIKTRCPLFTPTSHRLICSRQGACVWPHLFTHTHARRYVDDGEYADDDFEELDTKLPFSEDMRKNSVRKKAVGEWVEYEDVDNGNAKFWYNERTQESTWEKPEGFEEGDGGDGGEGMAGLEDYLNDVATNVDPPMSDDILKSARGGKSSAKKTSDWEMHVDAESKQVYVRERNKWRQVERARETRAAHSRARRVETSRNPTRV